MSKIPKQSINHLTYNVGGKVKCNDDVDHKKQWSSHIFSIRLHHHIRIAKITHTHTHTLLMGHAAFLYPQNKHNNYFAVVCVMKRLMKDKEKEEKYCNKRK